MKKSPMITSSDCKYNGTIDLPDGRAIKIDYLDDNSFLTDPWEEYDGNGIISKWRRGTDKRSGERVICSDRGSSRFYNMTAVLAKAHAEGWRIREEDKARLARALGRPPTAREVVAEAVELDFNLWQGWLNGEWSYVTVSVSLLDEEGNELASDSLGGVESPGDYASHQAAGMANNLIDWLGREVVTS